jgi:hypothetical protein
VRYYTPDLEGNRIAYKGRRFWIVEVLPGGGFQGFGPPEWGDFVVYDRLYGGPLACVTRNQDGIFSATTVTYLESQCEASTLKELAQKMYFIVEAEMRAMG